LEACVDSANGNEWLNLGEAAEMLGVHPSTLRAWADHGEIPAHRTPGKHRRFRRADVEAWAAARREAHPTAGQMIVENALGRTRIQMAEGQLKQAEWYARLDDVLKREFREAGRNLLSVLLRYLGETGEAALEEGKTIGQTYERLGRAAGLTLSEKVSVFLYFRDFLYDSVIDVYQASGQRAAREWAHMHRRIAVFTNAVLLALVEAHEIHAQV
jgi:excisionase family DNA binding protein